MERKNISYLKGITRSPSDILSQDGELSECINLEVQDGELIPMEMPVKMGITLNSNEKLLMVHNIKSISRKNYITSIGTQINAFYIIGSTKVDYSLGLDLGESVKSIQEIGNTIVIYTESQTHYLLYTGIIYRYLGTSIPELGLSFNLRGTMTVTATAPVDVPSQDGLNPDLSTEENRQKATSQILALVNDFIAQESEEKGMFIFPFFVRYAYRMFDGTYTMHSSPVLLMPSTTMAPVCGYIARTDERPPFKTFVAAVPSYLTVCKVDSNRLSDWSDIISEVAIFVSAPIRTYDQNGTVKSASYASSSSSSSKSLFCGSLNYGDFKRYTIGDNMNLSSNNPGTFVWWELPQRKTEAVMADMAECSLFYKYVSLSVSEADNLMLGLASSQVFYPEEVGVNPVKNVQTLEAMTDDYMTHDKFIPEYTFVYNSRLNISSIRRYLFQGHSADALMQMLKTSTDGLYHIYTFIKTQEGDKVVKSRPVFNTFSIFGTYLFYPDSDAYKMIIHDTYNNRYAQIQLTEHKLLNGAYYLSFFEELPFTSGSPSVQASSDPSEYLPNKLYTSEVNNPFHFPLSGMNTIGSGRIIGMSAMTRPISTGQAGEVPFILFCSDGNYALQVDSEGFYDRVFPIQEDTALGHDMITPMENSIALITKKGIMVTDAGEMSQIALQMEGSVSDTSYINIGTEPFTSIMQEANDPSGFKAFLQDARMAYDYASDRMVIYNTSKYYSFVYSFKNGTMTKMYLDGERIVTSVRDYPDTILQGSTGNLYSLYTKEDRSRSSKRQYGLLVTRPLTLDNPYAYKSIYGIKNIDTAKENSFVKYALYGSMDGVNFIRLNSLRSKSYLYYTMVICTYMLPKEHFVGSAMEFQYRNSHKIR